MKKIKTLILTGYGLNCEDETAYAFNLAGAEADKIHINSLIEKKSLLKKYKILALVGGFSWGDDHGAGVLEALRLKTEIGEQILEFIEDDKIIIGICNGFQTLVNMGLLPGFADYSEDRKKVEKKASSLSFIKKTGKYKHIERLAGFTINNSGTFVDKWVYLKANKNSPCVFTKNITELELPVRHAEGKFFAEDKIIKKLIADNQVVIRYADSAFRPAEGNPLYNPNGSTYDIAGICDSTGRIFGLMPHPESFNSYMNHPNWTLKREISARSSAPPVEETEKLGIKIFQNAVKYFRQRLWQSIRPLHNFVFCPFSALCLNFNPRNTWSIPAVKILARLENEQNSLLCTDLIVSFFSCVALNARFSLPKSDKNVFAKLIPVRSDLNYYTKLYSNF